MPDALGSTTAPPVAPQQEPANQPNAPRGAGVDSLKEALRSFGEKFTTVADEDPRASGTDPGGRTLSDVIERTDEGDDDGAAHEAAPSASEPVQGADGKWRNPDGSFARDPNAPPDEPKSPAAAPDDTKAPATDAADETVPFTLKGLQDRGEEDVEIDVPKEYEERFRRLTNDANRYRGVQTRLDSIESKEADFEVMSNRMTSNPAEWVLSRVPKEAQVQIAKMLVAEHWDALLDTLVKYDTDMKTGGAERRVELANHKLQVRDAEDRWRQMEVMGRAKARISRLIDEAVPNDTSASRAERFTLLSRQAIDRWYETNRAIPSPEQVKTVLAEVAADMGFAPPAPTGGQPAVNGTKPAAPQAKAQGTARPNKVDARAAQAARSRAIARRIAPAGVGGAPAMAPVIPPTSSTDKSKSPIKERIKWLRENPGSLRAVDAGQLG